MSNQFVQTSLTYLKTSPRIRADEQVALADTIKILNDDDAFGLVCEEHAPAVLLLFRAEPLNKCDVLCTVSLLCILKHSFEASTRP